MMMHKEEGRRVVVRVRRRSMRQVKRGPNLEAGWEKLVETGLKWVKNTFKIG